MPKRILRNALLMAAVTFLMALGLLFYIRSTGPLPGAARPAASCCTTGCTPRPSRATSAR